MGGGFQIWKTTEGNSSQGDSYGRPGNWLGKGSQWWIRRQYPFPTVDGKRGHFEPGLPQLQLPGYSNYSNQEEARLSWLLRFGDGGSLVVSGELETGSDLHNPASIEFQPASSYSVSHSIYGVGEQYVFRAYGASNPLYVVQITGTGDPYTINVYDGMYLTGAGPFSASTLSSGSWVVDSFTVDKISSSYEYGLSIGKNSALTSEFHGSASTSGFSAREIHDTGVGTTTREHEVSSTFSSGVRTLQRTVRENSGGTVLSSTTDKYKIIAGLERPVSHEATVDSGSTTRKTSYTWEETASNVNYGRLLKKENHYGGTLTDWTVYRYETPSGIFKVHEYSPWKDTPSTPPASPSPTSHTGRLVTTEYHEATSTLPRRVKRVTEKLSNTKTSDVEYNYDTVTESGITFDRKTEKRYNSSSGYLETEYVTWPRQPTSSYRHWAMRPRYTQSPTTPRSGTRIPVAERPRTP